MLCMLTKTCCLSLLHSRQSAPCGAAVPPSGDAQARYSGFVERQRSPGAAHMGLVGLSWWPGLLARWACTGFLWVRMWPQPLIFLSSLAGSRNTWPLVS